ncbi:Serine threonine-kinase [Hyphodiscus hymeniophilus]|uniref:Serine threonine-kinase n=1 Tax=Hyphodiscus hymeniophilus TaxID=353542 RepID=A0A9P6VEQ7_9HELO|nr:Serine threonine-kinase [Hyphodiscus hymeniophilus]
MFDTFVSDAPEKEIISIIELFKKHQLNDELLPIEDITGKCKAQSFRPRGRNSQKVELRECTHDAALNVFHDGRWESLKFRRFRQTQGIFSAPVLRKHGFKQELSAGAVLPFTWTCKKTMEGHFSRVYEAGLHSDHQDEFVTHGEDVHVAVKELNDLPADKGYNVETAWNLEAEALEQISQLRHQHLIRRIAAFKRGLQHFILFEWADGGTLRDVWKRNAAEHLDLNGDKIMGLLEQLHGLAGALCALHNTNSKTKTAKATRKKTYASPSAEGFTNNERDGTSIIISVDAPPEDDYEDDSDDGYNSDDSDISSGDEHWRHGDLKPDNILKFEGSTCLGTLKIADLGLAKQHKYKTADRRDPTKQRYATEQYEAPEVITNHSQPRSRRYDVWSMGCIIFESVIWLLYGYNGLKAFYKEEDYIDTASETLYFTANKSQGSAKVSDIVTSWMKQILKDDPECNQPAGTALGDLLKLVRDELLIVALPEPNMKPEALAQCRADSAILLAKLRKIWKHARDRSIYLFTGNSREGGQKPTPLGGKKVLDDIWQFLDDNAFAVDLLHGQESKYSSAWPQQTPELCERCRQLNFWTVDFALKDTLEGLETKSQTCDFCSLLLSTCTPELLRIDDPSVVYFSRSGSRLNLNDGVTPVLSICRTRLNNYPQSFQIGFPKLLTIKSAAYFDVLRGWLEDCNKHAECSSNITTPTRYPTRMIDVGQVGSHKVYLCETAEWEVPRKAISEYIALSHPWGGTMSNDHFCTTNSNIHDRVHKGMLVDDLPDTFKHAVTVTRELDTRYLWIDSLCIIQGDDGDFKDEAQHMESVFSSALCVIAASRATGTSAGFLMERRDRRFVKIGEAGASPFYVCEAIDDFQHDVIDGALNKRGWVLQERALARRTIYFTETQTYWECGEGIRCETLTKMRNNQAAFLGDPNFPNVATKSTKGGQIRLYEHLYKQYSTLQFSKAYDRPIAIAGLEQRLISTFNRQGGYGVFEKYFGRSLLWQRDTTIKDIAMKDIKFPSNENTRVPSWSWMAYEGGISFLDIPFDGVLWKEDEDGEEIRSPWIRSGASSSSWHTADSNGRIDLTCKVRDLRLDLADQSIVYDKLVRPRGRAVKCVVIGRKKSNVPTDEAEQEHYILVVAPRLDGSKDAYERVGVGSSPGSWIAMDGPGLKVHVF